MDYQLTNLGPENFEHLAQALLLAEFGPGVTVFGRGPDGGREATYDGDLTFGTLSRADDVWRGHTVFQAKFTSGSRGEGGDARWLRDTISKELSAWQDRKMQLESAEVPDNLLILTNARLSAVRDKGGHDRLEKLLSERMPKLDIKKHAIWDYDQLCRLLDKHLSIRLTYSALIAPVDVVSHLIEVIGEKLPIEKQLKEHLAREIVSDHWIHLNQQGVEGSERLTLEQVVVDLPGLTQFGEKVDLAAHIIKHSNSAYRPSLKPTRPAHLVLVGGPGQGKTTISQLIAQAYRVEFLTDSPIAESNTHAGRVWRETRSVLTGQAVPAPDSRRWPINVKLAEYAEAILGGERRSLLSWMALQISSRATSKVSPAQLRGFLKRWASIVILDGLDEVSHASVRDTLRERIDEFLISCTEDDADLVLLITTRPQGYDYSLHEIEFGHLEMSDLDMNETLSYASKLVDLRLSDDPDLHDRVMQRLTAAGADEVTSKLMRTPLQVMLMSILMERIVRLPRTRFDLFDGYFDAVYSREAAKHGHVGEFLAQYRSNVTALHETVALRLQVMSETSGRVDPYITQNELRNYASAQLTDDGHREPEVGRLVQQIVDVSTHRLVLLVPSRQGSAFEVRSLQEYMAARAITKGSDDAVVDRLLRVSASSYWRNVWQLGFSRAFASREHLRDALISSIQRVDSWSPVTWRGILGPELALAVLQDNVVATTPNHRRSLLKQALEVLTLPPRLGPMDDVAEALLQVSSADRECREAIQSSLTRARDGSPDSRATAHMVILSIGKRPGQGRTGSLGHSLRNADSFVAGHQEASRLALQDWARVRGRPRDYRHGSYPDRGHMMRGG